MSGIMVREMTLAETETVIGYFHGASVGFLESLGVSRAKLPDPGGWRAFYRADYALPIEERQTFLVVWEMAGRTVGFSTADKIVFGQQAHMHLHMLTAENRRKGFGAAAVRQSAEIYFRVLKLRQLYCEPFAFNAAPNRTLQKAGFKYIQTYETIPGPVNFRQPVNRWLLERADSASDGSPTR